MVSPKMQSTRSISFEHKFAILIIYPSRNIEQKCGWKYKCESHRQENERRQKWKEREGM